MPIGAAGSIRSSSTGQSAASAITRKPKNRAQLLKQRLIEKNKRHDLVFVWENRIKPALIQTFSILLKDSNNGILSVLGLLIEFLQLLAYAFPSGGTWHQVGNVFGNGIRYLQFDYIVYSIAGLNPFDSAPAVSALAKVVMLGFLIGVLCFYLLTLFLFIGILYSFYKGNYPNESIVTSCRWLISLQCSIFYLPLIQFFLVNIRLGAVLGLMTPLVLGALGCVFVVPSVLIMILIMYNPTSTSSAVFNRLDVSIDIQIFVFKTLVTAVAVGLCQSFPFILPVLLLVSSVIMTIHVAKSLPYYRKIVNQARFNLFLISAIAGLIGTVCSTGLFTADNDGPIIALIVGSIAVFTIGNFIFNLIYHRKITSKYLILKNEGALDSTVMFYEDKLMNINFKSPLEVEKFARFIRNDVILRMDTSRSLNIAKAIYNRGFSLFDNDWLMLCLYGAFLGIYCKDHQAWKAYIEKASLATSGFFSSIHLTCFRAEREIEAKHNRNSIDDALDSVDLSEIKLNVKTATKRSSKVKEYISDLWRLLLTGKVDPDQLQNLIFKINANQDHAKRMLERTVLKYPHSVPALIAYAKYLDEIERRYEEAEELWSIVEEMKVKEVKQLKVNVTTKSNNALEAVRRSVKSLKEEPPTRIAANIQVGPSSAEKKPITSDSSSALGSKSVHRKRPMSAKDYKRFSEYRESVKYLKSNAIPSFKKTLFVLLIIFLCAPIAQISTLVSGDNTIIDNTNDIVISAGRRDIAAQLPLKLLYMKGIVQANESSSLIPYMQYDFPDNYTFGEYVSVDGQSYLLPKEFNYLRQILLDKLQTFQEAQSTLFFLIDPTQTVFLNWIVPSVQIQYYLDANLTDPIWNNTLNFWDASTEFWRHAGYVLNQVDPLAFFTSSSIDYDTNWRFIYDNFAFVFGVAYNSGTIAYTDENKHVIMKTIDIAWIILGVCGGLIAIIGVFFIRKAVNKSFKELDMATAALLAVPRTSIESYYGQVKLLLNVQTKHKLDYTEKSMPDEEEKQDFEHEILDLDDDDIYFSDVAIGATQSRARSYVIMFAQYMVALMMIILTITMYTVVNYNQSLALVQNAIKTDYSLRIGFYANRIAYSALMLDISDTVTYPDLNVLKTEITADLSSFSEMYYALVFGDPSLLLPLQALSTRLQEVMYSDWYLGNTTSLDESIQSFIKSVNVILRSPIPFASNNPDVLNVCQLAPIIDSGFALYESANQEDFQNQLIYRNSLAYGLFALVMVLFALIYAILFRRIMSGMTREHRKSIALLLHIPTDAIKTNYPLQVLLRGREEAQDYFRNEEIEGVDVDKNGVPIPRYSVTNLDYVNEVATSSFKDLSYFLSNLKSKVVCAITGKQSHGSLDEKETWSENQSLPNDYSSSEQEQDDESEDDGMQVDEEVKLEKMYQGVDRSTIVPDTVLMVKSDPETVHKLNVGKSTRENQQHLDKERYETKKSSSLYQFGEVPISSVPGILKSSMGIVSASSSAVEVRKAVKFSEVPCANNENPEQNNKDL